MGDTHELGPTPLPPTVVGLLQKSDIPVKSEELNELSHVVIPHRHFQAGLGSVARIHQSFDPYPDAEAGFLLLRGCPRSGKSHILKFYRRQFPKRKGERGWIRPVLYVRAPAQGGSHALLREILKDLEVQVIGSRRGFELIADVGLHLREQRVELLILDEFQHVVDRKTDNYSYAAADVLKNFLSMNACQFVFAGLDIATEALAVNLQFDGRKADEFEMQKYDWFSEIEQADYLDYLAELADQTVSLGMFSVRPPLDGDDLGRRIHYATNGLVGLTSRLVRCAADIALRSEKVTITIEEFRQAFEILKRVGVTENPFVGECPVLNPNRAEELLTLGEDDAEPTNLSKRGNRPPRASFSR